MSELIDKKIEEAQDILKRLGLPSSQQNKLAALTLLALGNVLPSTEWSSASKKSMTLSKDIMGFVNDHYGSDYKSGSRESFRKIALKPFVDSNIVLLNPDEPDLDLHSSKTHYALSDITLDAIRQYNKDGWEDALSHFKLHQFPQNSPSNVFLKKLSVTNYKSILGDQIELGRFNIFIGVNGCGKTNILEAIATIGAAQTSDLNFEELYGRGVRIARPDLIISSFLKTDQQDTIDITLEFEENKQVSICKSSLSPDDRNDIYTKWVDKNSPPNKEDLPNLINQFFEDLYKENKQTLGREEVLDELNTRLKQHSISIEKTSFYNLLADYAIFDLNTKSLRGITPVDSRKTPLGINGEGLDLLVSNFNTYEKDFLDSTSKTFFDWLDKIQTEKNEKIKSLGLKAGRSTSTLYFTDRFMQKKNNTFSAENSNEGILHVLFYLALFISNKTPNLFAIDNIETALNPRLCQKLIIELVKLSKERGKQVLITTHNPAILDGLNLLDDDQRLFEVFRDSEGKTKTRRIKFKSDLSDKKYKLSEMWLKGQLGAIPQNF